MQDYPFHPLCEQYPMMPDAEFTLLVADMKEGGYDPRFPIFLFDGKILDGRTKYLAAKHAKVEPVFKNLPKDTDLEAFVERANEHRRHLTPEWITAKRKERISRVAEKKTEGKSNRAIAQEEGVSEGQVRRDLEEASGASGGDAPGMPTPDVSGIPNGKVTGKDGKKYDAKKKKLCETCTRRGVRKDCPDCAALNATKKKGPKKAKPEEMNGVHEEPPPPPDTDKHGHKIPPKAADAFANLKRFEELDSLVRKVQSGIDELSKLPGGEQLRQHLQPTGSEGKTINKSEHLNALKRDIRFTRPHSVCPHCAAKRPTCTACNGTGWVTETTWKNTEDKVKEKLDVHA